jgi:hypothetical protein
MPREKPRSGRTAPTKDGSALSEGEKIDLTAPVEKPRFKDLSAPAPARASEPTRARRLSNAVRARVQAQLVRPVECEVPGCGWRLACDLSDTRGSSKLIKQSSDTRTSNGLRRIAPIPQNVRRIHLVHLRDQPSLLSRCLMKLRAIGLRIHNPFTEPCQNVAEPYDDLTRR